jgi:hypothetical protein
VVIVTVVVEAVAAVVAVIAVIVVVVVIVVTTTVVADGTGKEERPGPHGFTIRKGLRVRKARLSPSQTSVLSPSLSLPLFLLLCVSLYLRRQQSRECS